MARLRQKLDLPREHGAWGMLLIPWAAGGIGAGFLAPPVGLVGGAALLAFVSRPAVLRWLRATRQDRPAGDAPALAVTYLVLAALVGAPLFTVYRLWGLLPLGGAVVILGVTNLMQTLQRDERSTVGEMLAIGGMCLTAPAAHYAGTGSWQPAAWWLYGLCVLYFASSVFYIKLRVATAHPKGGGPVALRATCAAYHVALTVVLAALTATGRLSPLVLAAFAAVLWRALWFVVRPRRELRLKRLGLLEVIYSLVFLLFVGWAYWPS